MSDQQTKRPLSIRARFLIVSLVSVPSALVLAAMFMTSIFSTNLERRLDAELTSHISNLAAAISFAPDGSVLQPQGFFDRRFTEAYGGLYWQIDDGAANAGLRSQSLWDFTLPRPDDMTATDAATGAALHRYKVAGPDGQQLIAQARQVMVASPSGTRTLRIVVAADSGPLDAASRTFALDIVPYLIGLAVFLIGASLIQVVFGLRPLSALTEGLNRIRKRKTGRLDGVLPAEFAPVETAVNRLLDAQAQAIAKARASAGDLAHGLKTPLTVLSNDALTLREKGETEIAGEIEHLVAMMRGHVERELTRSRIVASAEMRQSDADLALITGQIVKTLKRTPQGEMLDWQIDIPDATMLPLDPHDLRELAGNLLENAVKWAAGSIVVRWVEERDVCHLVIEDDGPGVDPEKIRSMTRRGVRLDNEVPGTGLGLSIVQEICAVYGLTLALENRQGQGLRACVSVTRQN